MTLLDLWFRNGIDPSLFFYFQSLNEIQPSGPVTIISETWTLPLALEVVSHAKLNNRKYRIFSLEGNPTNWLDLESSSLKITNLIYTDDIFQLNNIVSFYHVILFVREFSTSVDDQ